MIVAAGATTTSHAVAVVERLQEQVGRQAISVGPLTIHPRFSVGIAFSRRGVTAQDLLRESDAALGSAKAHGKGRWEVYDEATRLEAARRLDVSQDLIAGMSEGLITPHFQPVVDMRDGTVLGYEALARWQRKGSLAPAKDWIDIAEESGLILEVGPLIIAESVAALATLAEPLTMSVNASAVELAHPGFARTVIEELATAGAEPSRLIVEVTEQSLLAAPESARANLAVLVDLGVGVHLDDFGTGYSSLRHLRELPVTGIKLDRSFTQSVDVGPQTTPDELVPALAQLCRQLGLSMIAEGVETDGQRVNLLRAGWQLGQGYFFGRAAPLPVPNLSSATTRRPTEPLASAPRAEPSPSPVQSEESRSPAARLGDHPSSNPR